MRNLELLNKKNLALILIFLIFSFSASSEEPVDIWSLDSKNSSEKNTAIENSEENAISQNTIYEMQSKKKNQIDIEEDQTLISKEIDIIGLYDPAENGLDINMWVNSDGEKILNLIRAINKMSLSSDASEILDILLLTNSYYPIKNISQEQFIQIKSDWLIKNSNYKLIEEYLLNNQIVNESPELMKYLVDEYLSRSEIEKSCEIFSKIKTFIEDEYLSKFNIYCLINNNDFEQAQLLFDLKKELGFSDKFYEKKINYLLGFEKEINSEISEKTILDFHLSHRTNINFNFQPSESTSQKIWRYLSTSNLLDNIQDIELSNLDKISTIEKATHDGNYTEKELYDLYKRFQFNINQLLNIKESSKLLTAIEARALIYQGILITTEPEKKLELMNALKRSFINEGTEKAFEKQLSVFLKEMDIENIPSNYTTFYNRYNNIKEVTLTNIKINNKILHQSKLLNYFEKNSEVKNINKELNDLLKKIKRDKKYFFSMKDIILVEALKSDGIKVSEKYKDLYKLNSSEMPEDIQIFIDNEETGLAMLRIVQVIGQDDLKNIDPETMYFIINTLNQLNIDPIRNQIILKVLPLKV
jgi:hypothetical protein